MKASVIIPAYNEEKYITETILALKKQDYPDMELIVVDNASTDRTVEIAAALGVTVLTESRKGTMFACECGRKKATGDIIVRIDADCVPRVSWLSEGISFFRDERIVVVSGPYEYYDASKFFRSLSFCLQKLVYVPVNDFFYLTGIPGGVTLGGNTFLRASALERIGGFDTDIAFYGDDTDVAKRMSKAGRIIFTSKLSMATSARRFKAEGNLKIACMYLFHFWRTIFSTTKRT